MDVLVEVHDEKELERAFQLKSRLIGVNNRNLKDFVVDFDRTLELLKDAPPGITFVAESGISTHDDLAPSRRSRHPLLPRRRGADAPARHRGGNQNAARRMTDLTHLDETGAARMVDVGGKPVTAREAVAVGRIAMSREAAAAIRQGAVKKGDVLAVARVAGIMAAKKTAELIPLCHPLPLTRVSIDLVSDETGVTATATAACQAQTGVEMEALTAVTVALLTDLRHGQGAR